MYTKGLVLRLEVLIQLVSHSVALIPIKSAIILTQIRAKIMYIAVIS